MTKNSIMSALALVLLFALASCSSSDDDNKLPFDPSQQTFTDAAGLTLNYSGQPIVGKSVTVVPSASDVHKATLTLAGDNQLGDVADALFPGLSGTLDCPGVIPGTPFVNLDVTLKEDATGFNFSGDSETEYCTFSYTGRLEPTALTLDIKNVKLKNLSLAGASWKLLPYVTDNHGAPTSNPITLVWQSTENVGFLPLESLLAIATRIPLIPNPADPNGDAVCVGQILPMMLQAVNFGEDGNITASYLNSKTGAVTDSPVNLAQYVITSEGKMLFFLNPQAVIADTQKDSKNRAIDTSSILVKLIPILGQYLAQGFPLEYSIDGNNMTASIGTEPLLTILKSTVVPMLSDPATLQQIEELIKSNEDMAGLADLITPMIKDLPKAINATTKIQIGLNFTK